MSLNELVLAALLALDLGDPRDTSAALLTDCFKGVAGESRADSGAAFDSVNA